MNFLLFFSSFIFLLSSLPGSVTGSANLPLPLLLEKAAIFIFPFGSVAFRLNTAGAFLTALTPVVAFRLFDLARPRPAPGPILLELEDEKKWTISLLMVLSLGILSPAFLHTGTGGITPAANLFFPLLTLERGRAWRKARRSGDRWIQGLAVAVAGGVALSLDLRWALFFPALILIPRPTFSTPKKDRWSVWLRFTLTGAVAVIAFLTPWIVLTSFQVATAEQLMRLLPVAIGTGYSTVFRAEASSFLLIGSLVLGFFIARGLKVLLTRFPKTVTSVFLICLATEFAWILFRPAKHMERERAQEHRRRGENFARLQVPDQAEEEFLAALAINPKDGPTFEKLGELFLEYGDGIRAAAAFDRAAQFQPKSQTLLANGASAELMNGQIPKAIALMREAVAMKQENDSLREKLALLYEKIAQPREAATHWKILSEHRPKDKSVLWRLAQTLAAAQAFDQAQKTIIRYLALDLDEGEEHAAHELNSLLERALSTRTLQ
ncbi:MAG: hypothetical protein IPN90_08735 [Elusimicrobia bacterium]|nr:hypothetical protein [Elusimicrobiota bacterium]